MGRLFKDFLTGTVYSCSECKTHLANSSDLISKEFHGRTGAAYLFHDGINFICGPVENRHLMTGLHTIKDIFCKCCNQSVGWKYEEAFEEDQKYKEGKIILEKAAISKLRGV